MTRIMISTLAALFAAAAIADDATFIEVLGIAQDAGYPQAGCYRPHCMPGWEDPARRRLATSIAVVDEPTRQTFLFDATPDMPEQLYRLNLVAPAAEYSLDGVFLTHAHIGHYTGLMQFGMEVMGALDVPVFAMPRMYEFLANNGPWDQLVRYDNIELVMLADGIAIELNTRLTITPFIVPHRDEYSETVGYRIDGPNRSAIFIPDIDKWDLWEVDIRDLVRSVDYALLDATFFADGELGGRDMSKILHPFVSESMERFADLTAEEKSRVIFIHMNHTNPLLIEGSPQQVAVEQAGFRIANEGMRLAL
jgi:pyrroloquinoline quinone biosynthesis protein B